MGMSAEIFAIGPFSADIADALSYPAEHYNNTRAGVPVVTSLFTYMPGSSSSREFAGLLGITDPWDFNQHKLRASVVDIAPLKTFFGTLHGSEITSPILRDLSASERRVSTFTSCRTAEE